ncbi:nucleotidyltransferase [Halobacillus sp. Cin3]|uniref:nucleotidyltransferase n=1 Tax=Halobacillus sp. Cin3 TaxID=2928441 RepID=UPI00248DB715|nr:nucleotidyltransferase [Halobacillus sp. Cin3]
MRSCGVVVEYNPFHNGHYYHLEQSREQSGADVMIAIMSGHFLQRGEPAIMDKWHRAETALKNGADLVLELPFLYAVQHSDYFSQGAVQTLAEAGVDAICFGSESGDIGAFMDAYSHMNVHQDEFNASLRSHLNEGHSFPESSRLAYESIQFPSGAVDLSQPNNILGYSYVKQIMSYAPSVTPLTIHRKNSHYHDEDITGPIASATSIRRQMLKAGTLTKETEQTLPSSVPSLLDDYKQMYGCWHEWEAYFHLLQYKILTMDEDTLRCVHGVDEGLEYRLKRAMKKAVTFEDFMNRVKTKRYTWTRLQRTMTHVLVGTDKEDARRGLRETPPPYARILGMNETGRKYLKWAKKETRIPFITQPQAIQHPLLDLEARAAAAYYSLFPADVRVSRLNREYEAPVILPSHP